MVAWFLAMFMLVPLLCVTGQLAKRMSLVLMFKTKEPGGVEPGLGLA